MRKVDFMLRERTSFVFSQVLYELVRSEYGNAESDMAWETACAESRVYRLLLDNDKVNELSMCAACFASTVFQKLHRQMEKNADQISDRAIDDLKFQLGLTGQAVFSALMPEMDEISLPDFPASSLKTGYPLCKHTLPEPWAKVGNNWLDFFHARLEVAFGKLEKLEEDAEVEYDCPEAMISRLYNKLLKLTEDPNYGVYYAAAVLNREMYNLNMAVEAEIAEIQARMDSDSEKTEEALDKIVEISQKIHTVESEDAVQECYLEMKSVAQWYYQTQANRSVWKKVIILLQNFMKRADVLNEDIYERLNDLLYGMNEASADNLQLIQYGSDDFFTNVNALDASLRQKMLKAASGVNLVETYLELFVQDEKFMRLGRIESDIPGMIIRHMFDILWNGTDEETKAFLRAYFLG